MMKIIRVNIFVCVCLLINSLALSQNKLSSTGYISSGYNVLSSGFGYPTGVEGSSLGTVGVSFTAGRILFMEERASDKPGTFGLDFSYVDFAINQNTISSRNLYGIPTESILRSAMISMKVGPVYSYATSPGLILDLYAQGVIGMSNFTYYDNYQNQPRQLSQMPQIRAAGGLRFGYQFLALNIEYNWGRPSIKTLDTNSGVIKSFNINQSFLKIGLSFKFSPFEQ